MAEQWTREEIDRIPLFYGDPKLQQKVCLELVKALKETNNAREHMSELLDELDLKTSVRDKLVRDLKNDETIHTPFKNCINAIVSSLGEKATIGTITSHLEDIGWTDGLNRILGFGWGKIEGVTRRVSPTSSTVEKTGVGVQLPSAEKRNELSEKETVVRKISFFSTTTPKKNGLEVGERVKRRVVTIMTADSGVDENGKQFVENQVFNLDGVDVKAVQRKFKNFEKHEVHEAFINFFDKWIVKNSTSCTMSVVLDALSDLQWDTLKKKLIDEDWAKVTD